MKNATAQLSLASTRVLIMAAAWLGLLTSILSAQTDSGWRAIRENGFRIESQEGAFRLRLGGRLQADFTFADADSELEGHFGQGALPDGFELRRARLFLEGLIYDRVKVKAQYDFAGGDAVAKDVFISLMSKWGNVTLGHHIEPFSLEGNTSSKHTPFVERATPVVVFTAGRNAGISASGSVGDRANWGVGAFYDAENFGTSVSEGRYNLTGRVAYRPTYENEGERLLHIGVGMTNREIESNGTLRFRGRAEAHLGPRLVDAGDLPADSAFLYNLELAGVFDRAWFQGEYFDAEINGTGLADPMFNGFYIQGGWYLTDDYKRYKTSLGAFDRQRPRSTWGKDGGKGAWELAARYSTADLSQASARARQLDSLTIGINWYPNSATRLMINLIRASLQDVGDVRYVVVRWQVDF